MISCNCLQSKLATWLLATSVDNVSKVTLTTTI